MAEPTRTNTEDTTTESDAAVRNKQEALRTAFYWAASDGWTDMLRELLKAGADPKWCFGAAYRAAENDRAETVKFLLEQQDSMVAAKDIFRVAARREHHATARAILDWMEKKGGERAPPVAPSPPAA